ncbi:MAG: PCRF domain-containing protein [Armatimonadota bacterium]
MDIKPALENLRDEFAEIETQLSDPEIIANQNKFRELSKRHSHLQPLLEAYDRYVEAQEQKEEAETLLEDTQDQEMREYLRAEMNEAEEALETLHDRIVRMLLPKDPDDEKDVVVEIRSGTGGEEAALFAADLFTMYSRWAERHGYMTEVIDEAVSDMGGYNRMTFSVSGENIHGKLRFESGVHRVQRVPETESQGRIHTSAATVVVLPEAEDIDIHIDPSDLTTETFRAGGPGGQHMQKNDTAVRITHEPTGIAVSSTNQRSQHQNRERAMNILRSKLYDRERQKRQRYLHISLKILSLPKIKIYL